MRPDVTDWFLSAEERDNGATELPPWTDGNVCTPLIHGVEYFRRLNAGSGTIRARAVVPNPDGFLKPGMMGRLRLAASAAYPALLVPDTAIVTDAARRVVYVVDKKDMVTMRPVQLGPLNGNLRVIRGGLSPQDRVIIGGIQRAMPGQKVRVRKGKIAAPTASEPDSSAPQPAPSSAATSAP